MPPRFTTLRDHLSSGAATSVLALVSRQKHSSALDTAGRLSAEALAGLPSARLVQAMSAPPALLSYLDWARPSRDVMPNEQPGGRFIAPIASDGGAFDG